MNTLNNINIEALAEQIVSRLTVEGLELISSAVRKKVAFTPHVLSVVSALSPVTTQVLSALRYRLA